MKIKVIYGDKQIAESGSEISPSAMKPKLMYDVLKSCDFVEFVEPVVISKQDILRCHGENFVNDILSLKRANGFGTFSQSVVDSLPYTNGAMYLAAKLAGKEPTCALVSGFHHAGYDGFENFGYFCTFNGLMIAATKLVEEDGYKRIAIVDCDMHWGNGTDDIIKRIDPKNEKYLNITFGKVLGPNHTAEQYVKYFDYTEQKLKDFKPDVIIYQSGADVHVNDPFGGILTEKEMYERDIKMFTIAKNLDIPLTWALAGGYQKDSQGGCSYVLDLHMNTFGACKEVYGRCKQFKPN